MPWLAPVYHHRLTERARRWIAQIASSPWIVAAPVVVYGARTLARGYDGMLGTLEDDAYYYLVTAERFVQTGRSTFDGTILTNGYHPLWFAICVVLTALAGLNRYITIPLLVCVLTGLSIWNAVLSVRLLQRLDTPRGIALLFAASLTARVIWIGFSGMECALTMPLMAACWLVTLRELEAEISSNRAMLHLAFWTSAIGLARLEALLFGGLCFVALFLAQRWPLRDLWRRTGLYTLGLIPFAVYLASNVYWFGSASTVSAEAKGLASGLVLNTELFASFSLGRRLTFLALPSVGLAVLLSPLSSWRGARRMLAFVVFVYPLFFYGALALRSSWQIWIWYFYPLPLAALVSGALLVDVGRARWPRLVPHVGYPFVLGGVALCALYASRAPIARTDDILRAAKELSIFAADHPGRYAMGDRAGLTAYLTGVSFLQLEGLMADRWLLDQIRNGAPLTTTLEHYDIDYLVETLPFDDAKEGACQTYTEPKRRQAGRRSPRLSGRYCSPLWRFDDRPKEISTLVYALRSQASVAR